MCAVHLCMCVCVCVLQFLRGAFRGAARAVAAAAFNAAQSKRPPLAPRPPRLLPCGARPWLAWGRAVGTCALRAIPSSDFFPPTTLLSLLFTVTPYGTSAQQVPYCLTHLLPPFPTRHASQAARDQLLATCRELQARGAAAPPSLLRSLHLLHCYLLVRVAVRQGDHPTAARLLLVVADSIPAFPRHAAAILTSTVIECHRAGLHSAAQVRQVATPAVAVGAPACEAAAQAAPAGLAQREIGESTACRTSPAAPRCPAHSPAALCRRAAAAALRWAGGGRVRQEDRGDRAAARLVGGLVRESGRAEGVQAAAAALAGPL